MAVIAFVNIGAKVGKGGEYLIKRTFSMGNTLKGDIFLLKVSTFSKKVSIFNKKVSIFNKKVSIFNKKEIGRAHV